MEERGQYLDALGVCMILGTRATLYPVPPATPFPLPAGVWLQAKEKSRLVTAGAAAERVPVLQDQMSCDK